MNFKKVELNGFKSFADKTEIKFGPGVTCIVGPNGCGKSNVADAIRWVFGEQSAKTMRGSSMQDVIFGGTQTRKSQSFCEVTLTFDNSTQMFSDLAYDEVAMTRRLYRSGESEYLINRQPCRMRDIVERLHNVGLGKDGYSIIGQNRIEQIMNAKPEDRRSVFEEATGIIVFKARRQEIERRLANSYNNLNVFMQRMSEVERMLTPLARQSEKTKKYRELYGQLKTNEINLYIYKHDNAETSRGQIRAEIARVENETENCRQIVADLENSYAENRKKLTEDDAVIQELNDRILQYTVEMEKKQGDVNVIRARITFFEDQLQGEKESARQAEIRLKEAVQEKTAAEAKAADYERKVEQSRKESEEIAEEAAKISRELAAYEEWSTDAYKSAMGRLEDLSEIRQSMGTLSAKKEAVEERLGEVFEACEKQKETLAADEKQLAETEDWKKELTEYLDGESGKLKEQEEKIARLTRDSESCGEEIFACSGRISALSDRVRFYRNVKEEFEGYKYSVKKLMTDAKKNPALAKRIRGVIADIVSCDEKYEVAIETAFGGAMQNIVTATADDARILIEHLKSTKGGSVTFLPVASLRPHYETDYTRRALKEKGAVGLATDLVSYDSYYDNVIYNLIGNTLVADNIFNATEISKKYPHAFKIVTLDGDVIATSGSMTGGSRRADSGSLLANERKIAEAEKAAADAEKECESLKKKRASLDREREKASGELAALRESFSEAHSRLAALAEKEETLRSRISAGYGTLRAQEDLLAVLNSRMQGIDSDFTATSENEARISVSTANAETESGRRREEYEKLRSELSERNLRSSSLQVYIAQYRAEAESGRAEIQRLSAEEKSLRERIEEASVNIENISRTIEDLKDLEEKTVLTPEQQAELASLRKAREEKQFEKGRINAEIETAMQRSREETERIERLSEEKHRQEISLTKIDSDLENLQARIAEEYQETYEGCLRYKADTFDAREGQTAVNRLRREINALGSINHNAVEEYEDLSAQYEEMKAQRDDVQKGIDDTSAALESLKSEMQKQFDEGFNRINTNFKKLFRELFGGGKAELQIDYAGCEDPLSAGVEIVACPPGKKLTKLSLLSGGERALTAIAILFAILMLRPMPFCVLDEIEAALDDANVDKFAQFLKKFAKETQFIVITHRKPTMEKADCLFGVTMEEKGVSKIVSVKLSEVETKLGGDTLQ